MSGHPSDADANNAPREGRTVEAYDDIPVEYRDHPWVTDLRIPLITSPYPRWCYEAALVVPPPTTDGESGSDARLYRAVWPTEDEAALVASYIGLRMTWYRDSWRAKMRRHALDTDAGTNTVTLVKTADGWRYKRATWTMHGLWPYSGNGNLADYPPSKAGLLALLTHAEGGHRDEPSARLTAWMDEHPREWTAA